jgi:hypothetical protein
MDLSKQSKLFLAVDEMKLRIVLFRIYIVLTLLNPSLSLSLLSRSCLFVFVGCHFSSFPVMMHSTSISSSPSWSRDPLLKSVAWLPNMLEKIRLWPKLSLRGVTWVVDASTTTFFIA